MALLSKTNPKVLEILSNSQVYRDYERAFTEGTGLPLRLQAPSPFQVVHYVEGQENPFCAMMAKSAGSCAQCYAMQCKVEEKAQHKPQTHECFAGMGETAVPVRMGENLIAFLHTGQVLLQRPDRVRFKQITETLLKWGAQLDLEKLEEHYFNTRVLAPLQYDALIRLLDQFA